MILEKLKAYKNKILQLFSSIVQKYFALEIHL